MVGVLNLIHLTDIADPDTGKNGDIIRNREGDEGPARGQRSPRDRSAEAPFPTDNSPAELDSDHSKKKSSCGKFSKRTIERESNKIAWR